MGLSKVFHLLCVLSLALVVCHAGGHQKSCKRPGWIHHTYSVTEVSTTDVVSPDFGTAPGQTGTSSSFFCFQKGMITHNLCNRHMGQLVVE